MTYDGLNENGLYRHIYLNFPSAAAEIIWVYEMAHWWRRYVTRGGLCIFKKLPHASLSLCLSVSVSLFPSWLEVGCQVLAMSPAPFQLQCKASCHGFVNATPLRNQELKFEVVIL